MRTKTLSLILSVPFVLSPACVQLEDDPAALELDDAGPDELVDHTRTATNQELAAAIAAHPAYAQLSSYSWQRASAMLGSYAALDQESLRVEGERLEYCSYQTQPLTCYDELSTVPVSFALSNSAKTAGQTLATTFGLSTMSAGDRVRLFHAAQQFYVSSGGPGGSQAMVPGTIAGQTCDAGCKGAVLIELSHAQAGFAAATTIATGGGGGGGGGGGDLAEILIKTAIEVAIDISASWIECMINPDCDTWPEGDGEDECNDDDDCLPDGWCHKGALGFGDNECRDKRENGAACSRDAKCESDCCKFSLWDLGSTCRPANECN